MGHGHFTGLPPVELVAIAGTAFLAIGAGGEYLAKTLDKDAHPTLRTLGILTTKVVQVAFTAFLLLYASFTALTFSLHPFALGGVAIGLGGLALGAVVLLTPVINPLIQNYGNEQMKYWATATDQIVSTVAKSVNILITAFFIGALEGNSFQLGLTVFWIASGVISIAALKKE